MSNSPPTYTLLAELLAHQENGPGSGAKFLNTSRSWEDDKFGSFGFPKPEASLMVGD
jgi:hypothetical protein